MSNSEFCSLHKAPWDTILKLQIFYLLSPKYLKCSFLNSYISVLTFFKAKHYDTQNGFRTEHFIAFAVLESIDRTQYYK